MSKFDEERKIFHSRFFQARNFWAHQQSKNKKLKQIKNGRLEKRFSLARLLLACGVSMRTEKALAATAIKLHLKQQGEHVRGLRHLIEAQHRKRSALQRSALFGLFPKSKSFQLAINEVSERLRRKTTELKCGMFPLRLFAGPTLATRGATPRRC
jgi:hypothetical protein